MALVQNPKNFNRQMGENISGIGNEDEQIPVLLKYYGIPKEWWAVQVM